MSADPRDLLSERGAALRTEGKKALAEHQLTALEAMAERAGSAVFRFPDKPCPQTGGLQWKPYSSLVVRRLRGVVEYIAIADHVGTYHIDRTEALALLGREAEQEA